MSPGRIAAGCLVAVGIAAAVAAAPTVRAAPAEAPSALERLEAAVHANPDDPDLLWAWAMALERRGDADAALALVDRFLARWPQRRPDALTARGRLLVTLGRPREALETLDRALAAHPDDAQAHFHRGLALRALGRSREAEQALARAAELDAALATESLVLRGLDRLTAGDVRGARALLDRALELDPRHAIARAARAALPDAAAESGRQLALSVHGGVELDSNVTLDSGLDLPGVSTEQEDTRRVFGASAGWTPWAGERGSARLVYRFDGTRHDDLDAFDLESHQASASLMLRPSRRTAVRLDGRGTHLELAGERYLDMATLEPSWLVAMGSGRWLVRLFGSAEWRNYHEEPILASLERDARILGGGLGLVRLLGSSGRGGLSLEARFDRTRTEGGTDLFGLDSAFDHDRYQLWSRIRIPLPLGVDALLGAGVGYEHYDHANVVDFLTDDGLGTDDPVARRDLVLDGRAGLSVPFSRFLALELAWRGTRRVSNVDLYDYRRSVVGAYVRATLER